MIWTDESGERLQSMSSLRTTLSDYTYERFEKINILVNHGTEQTFVCIAVGDSVNGTSTAEITLLPISGKRENVGLIVGLVIGIPAGVSILFLLFRKFRQASDQEYLQQRVSEESSPAQQTTIDFEDGSRKWYSVQWSDFKFCCRRLKDVSTQHPRIPFCVYALYRFTLAAYFFGFLITYIILAREAVGPKIFIFPGFWTHITTTCYVCFACFNVAMDLKNSMTKAAHEDKLRYQIQWFLFNFTAAPSILTTLADWQHLNFVVFIISDKVPLLLYISLQPLPAVVCLIEIFLTLIVVRFVHAVYPFLFVITYELFLVTYWATGGTDQNGYRITAYYLNFEEYPGIAAGILVGCVLTTLVFHAILKGLYAIRVRCMDRRTEAVPLTDEVPAVELE
ncbi:uncharacterized protein [Diadema setosum]|uniref:uncharacterized protein n=1 Tax=Diadema setosum TaxID=31175 RepID=UPI003B3AEDA6